MEAEAMKHAVLEGRLPEGAAVMSIGFGQKLLNLIRSTRTHPACRSPLTSTVATIPPALNRHPNRSQCFAFSRARFCPSGTTRSRPDVKLFLRQPQGIINKMIAGLCCPDCRGPLSTVQDELRRPSCGPAGKCAGGVPPNTIGAVDRDSGSLA
jgi:hypothetical protein